jgi:hypothetical protein
MGDRAGVMIEEPTQISPAATALGMKVPAGKPSAVPAKGGQQRPALTILLVSLLAVIVNCYPVIFCGRSYVSPACVGSLVYDWWPPMPGMAPVRPASLPGCDTGATMWGAVPMGMVESRSFLKQGEIPLWNRYSHAGTPLIGQAVSMLGDPLHLIVLIGRGTAVAWDIKYLVAKLVFCVGFGLLVLRLLGSKPLALIYAALGAWCGAFFVIVNHPVFFVFAYAPWILLSAMEMLDLRPGGRVRWGLIWLLATVGCFNGGHVEPAVDLIAGLNLAALAAVLVRNRGAAPALRVLGRMGVATLLFLGLTAPVWVSFLAAMDGAYSAHETIRVFQQPLTSLPGAFDDNFYRGVAWTTAPGSSLLVLAGCILSALKWRQVRDQPFFWVNAGAIVLWGGFVFGWVPAPVLASIPLLNRVGHIGTDFSYLLVIHLTIQSAYGFWCLAGEADARRVVRDALWMFLIFLVMMCEYSLVTAYNLAGWSYFLRAGLGALGAPLLFFYLKNRYGRVPRLGWAGILLLGLAAQYRFGLYASGNEPLLLVPGPRVNLTARSEAVDRLKAASTAPFRVTSLQRTFCGAFAGDYAAAYELEDIRSCEPLTDGRYIDLVRHFPGMTLNNDWILGTVDPAQAQPLLNLLNIKYLLANPVEDTQPIPGFQVANRSDFLVLENPQVWPRAFFVNQVTVASSTEQFIKQLEDNGSKPFVSVAGEVLEKQPGLRQLRDARAPTVSPATDYQLRPNSTAFNVHATSAGIVCLTEGEGKDFTVKANNATKEVLTVNRAFKGVYLDRPGDYHIEFIYRPRHWGLACALFWVSAASALGLLAMEKLRAANQTTRLATS